MAEPSGLGLTFSDFLGKMKDPAAADLVRNIKSFIRNFEERPSGHAVDPEADSAKVQAFLGQSEQLFRQHPVWRGCQSEVLDQAVEGLEKYVMSKVWRQTFGAWQEDRERDERYQRLMQALGFVDLPTLMGADVHPDTNLLALAQGEMLKMDRYKAPRDKLLCLVNVKTMVENIVQLAARNGASIGGADAFFPVFLFVVIRSRMPHLASNVEYMKRFRMHARLSGQFDYMLCNLESSAVYLDTVNYEHLAVSQEQFLAHLAAAGIPEAHIELQRMQQQQQAAAAVAAAAVTARQADLGADYGWPPAVEQQPGAAAADGEAAADAASAAAAAGAAHLQQQAAASVLADADPEEDILAGLQLADDSADACAAAAAADDEEGNAVGRDSVQPSFPASPEEVAGALLGLEESSASVAGEGSPPSLTPLRTTPSPEMLEPVTAGPTSGGGGGGDDAGTAAMQAGSNANRGLSFDSELATAEQQQEQRQQHELLQQQQQQEVDEERADAAAALEAAAAAAASEQYAEAALIEEMVSEGTRHVLAAEAAGMLQQRYPYMYAQAEDLLLPDVQAVLVGYKELLLRYEALSRALQQQLGLGGSPAAAATGGRAGHRSKQQQEQYGFGSLIPPGLDGSWGAASRAHSAPSLAVAAPAAGAAGSHGSPAAAVAAAAPGAAGSADASPSGKWSPGGILQRIASRSSRRSLTPPKDRAGGRAAAAAAAEEEAQLSAPAAEAGSGRLLPGRAVSPGRQGDHPFFNTLFGGGSTSASSPKLDGGQQQPLQPQQQQQQQQRQAQRAHVAAVAQQRQAQVPAAETAAIGSPVAAARPAPGVALQLPLHAPHEAGEAGPELSVVEEPCSTAAARQPVSSTAQTGAAADAPPAAASATAAAAPEACEPAVAAAEAATPAAAAVEAATPAVASGLLDEPFEQQHGEQQQGQQQRVLVAGVAGQQRQPPEQQQAQQAGDALHDLIQLDSSKSEAADSPVELGADAEQAAMEAGRQGEQQGEQQEQQQPSLWHEREGGEAGDQAAVPAPEGAADGGSGGGGSDAEAENPSQPTELSLL